MQCNLKLLTKNVLQLILERMHCGYCALKFWYCLAPWSLRHMKKDLRDYLMNVIKKKYLIHDCCGDVGVEVITSRFVPYVYCQAQPLNVGLSFLRDRDKTSIYCLLQHGNGYFMGYQIKYMADVDLKTLKQIRLYSKW